ncbi:MAG: BtpA/SgcQ family protein [Actinobacteria bacterium]|nr:MAG: BtpA/SgcQ family protein [Actinomycetota bacterium]
MVHLGALPGAPRYQGSLDEVIAAALRDATTLEAAGFDGLMVENFGDSPFFAEDVPKETVAAMTRAVGAVIDATGLPTGVNVLRNDAAAALAVAAATGAGFIRVNVLSGTMFTDQGAITGRAAEVARTRARLCPEVAIMADVFVKHATPPHGWTLGNATRDLSERSGADAIVVSGPGTGAATDPHDIEVVGQATELPLYVGSGADSATIAALLQIATGAIVGSSLKVDGDPTNPVDLDRAMALVTAAD